MKIAILGARSYPPKMSGIDNQVYELSNRLAGKGHDMFLFVAEGSHGPPGVHVKKIPQISMELGDLSLSYLTCNAFSLPYVARVVKKRKIELIHANNPIAGIIGAAVKRLTGRPLVYTIRGTIPDNIRARGGKVGRILSVFEKRALAQADAITAITPYIGKTTALWHRMKKDLKIIPNGVDLEKFRKGDGAKIRREFGLGKNEKVFLFVGRLVGVKGLGTLMEAMKYLQDAKLLVAGDGPLMAELSSKAGNNVIFAGMRRDVPDLLAACDALVLPSLHEGFPNVVLEAMAAGRPVVASRIMSIPDIVEEGVTGLLFRVGDAEDLANKMQDMAGDAKTAERMGKAARKASEKYSWENLAKSMENLYQEVIENKKRK